MLANPMDRLFAASFAILACLFGWQTLEDGAPGPPLFTEPAQAWTFGQSEDDFVHPFQASIAPEMFVDVALVHKSRASLGETLLAGAGLPIFREISRSVALSFDHGLTSSDQDEPSSTVQWQTTTTLLAQEGFRPVEVDAPQSVNLSFECKYLGFTNAAAHLLDVKVTSKSISNIRFAQGIALSSGAIVATPIGADYLLLVGLSEVTGPDAASNRLAAWRQRAQAALARAPVTNDALGEALGRGDEGIAEGAKKPQFTLIDPAIELATLAMFLGDRELMAEARVALDGTYEQVLARLEASKPWAERKPEGVALMFGGFHWLDRLTAVVVSGALPLDGAFPKQAPVQGPGISLAATSSWNVRGRQ